MDALVGTSRGIIGNSKIKPHATVSANFSTDMHSCRLEMVEKQCRTKSKNEATGSVSTRAGVRPPLLELFDCLS